jgi:hypothetical protein
MNLLRPTRVSPAVLLVICCLLNWPVLDLYAVDYYVSAQGNDTSPGTTPAEAWKTIERANRMNFAAGDRLLFEAGAVFKGTLAFSEDDGGKPDDPFIVSSYGTGHALIETGRDAGLIAHNVGGLTVRQLTFHGDGRDTNGANGIGFYNDLPGDIKLANVHIDDVEVSGFGKNGIAIAGWNGGSGYRDVRITNSIVHDNGLNGLIVFAPQRDVHERVYIGQVEAYRNSGQPDVRPNSGNGIVLGNTVYGLIERSRAHDNGWLGTGSVGIWAYASRMILIQNNESFSNRTAGQTDGGGFGLDGGMMDSVMQDNFSYDNDGAGFGLYQYPGAPSWERNTILRNFSLDDGRKNSHAGIQIWNEGGGLRHADIHDNTVVISSSNHGIPAAVYFMSESESFSIHHNVFMAHGDAKVLNIAANQTRLRFYGNWYWPGLFD